MLKWFILREGQILEFMLKVKLYTLNQKKTISPYKAKYSLNSVLPDDIRILSFENISSDFNARKAKSRVYYYLFTPYENIPLYMTKYLTFINFLPNESLFQKIEKLIVGYNNFINFVKKGSYEKTTFRTIFHISISKKKIKSLYQSCEAYYYEFHIVADGFLYRMVRNLVGAFFEVISERQSFSSFQDFFLGKISDFRYHAAPAKGLCLTKVNY